MQIPVLGFASYSEMFCCTNSEITPYEGGGQWDPLRLYGASQPIAERGVPTQTVRISVYK